MEFTIEVNHWIASGMADFLKSQMFTLDSHIVDPGGDGLDYLHVSRGFHVCVPVLDRKLKRVGFHESQYKIIEN